jgi:uncharacterized membrane protein (DUF106 family)
MVSFLSTLFDPIFAPLLGLGPFWIIFAIALIATVIITIIYKIVTDQDLMKRLKEDQKDMQKKMKEFREHPEKLAQLQKEMWSKSMEQMKHSFKPTMFTFIPILILFGWLSAHLAFVPLYPGEPVYVTVNFDSGIEGTAKIVAQGLELLSEEQAEIEDGKSSWKLQGPSGKYILEFYHEDQIYEKTILITSKQSYEPPVKNVNDGKVKSIEVLHKEVKPFGNFSFFGWKPGWFGTYFLLSIFLSMSIRKLFKVH